MEMWCIKIGLRPMIAIFTVIRFSKYTTLLLLYIEIIIYIVLAQGRPRVRKMKKKMKSKGKQGTWR